MKIINNFFIDVFYSYQAEPVSRQNTDSMLNNCNKLLTKPYAEKGLFLSVPVFSGADFFNVI
ncbi:hypothetical protein AYY18_10060 [Morganella psychrotolerans]|uniref:Uncharacterized protein n=1 Tax=Morganella psychrotolerans TaxID=368603 RepID=A0A1B8H5D0_9GAMM|nr:hypothetical protein AYY18_10060 [Morganella psychrotolerans]